MQILERLTALQILSEECRQVFLIDSSWSPKRNVELRMLPRSTAIRVPAHADRLYVAKIHSHRSSRLCPGIAMVETS